MVDTYTKVILTVIAAALIVLAARPMLETRTAHASGTVDVNIVGISSHSRFDMALPVRCDEGCR